MLQTCDNSVTLNEYNLHISWKDKTIIYADGRSNEGWLKDLELIDLQEYIDYFDQKIREVDQFWRNRKEKS